MTVIELASGYTRSAPGDQLVARRILTSQRVLTAADYSAVASAILQEIKTDFVNDLLAQLTTLGQRQELQAMTARHVLTTVEGF